MARHCLLARTRGIALHALPVKMPPPDLWAGAGQAGGPSLGDVRAKATEPPSLTEALLDVGAQKHLGLMVINNPLCLFIRL